MKGFFLGLLVASVAFFAYLWFKDARRREDPPVSAAADAGAKSGSARKRTRPRGARRVAVDSRRPVAADHAPPAGAESGLEGEPEPVRLSAADLRSVRRGDDLSRPDVLRLDLADGRATRELDQSDIDEGFRPREPAILDCIGRARPDPEAYVPGRVTIRFRIQRTGVVRGVEVEAPAILHEGGLYECVRGVVGDLRFPASGSSQIVTYPFTLS